MQILDRADQGDLRAVQSTHGPPVALVVDKKTKTGCVYQMISAGWPSQLTDHRPLTHVVMSDLDV